MMNLFVGVFAVSTIVLAQGQQPVSNPSTSTPVDPQLQIASPKARTVPPFLPLNGVLVDSSGKPVVGSVETTFTIHSEREGGPALWTEVQTVQADQRGQYHVTLGAATWNGIPVEIFAAGGLRWLGVLPVGEQELSRTPILSVPYALKAGDAETLGGKPASAFVVATEHEAREVTTSSAGGSTGTTAAAAPAAPSPTAQSFTATANPGPGFISQATSGPPLQVSSTAININLNADLLDGLHETAFPKLAIPNVFAANQMINGSLTINGTATAPWGNFAGTTGLDAGGVPIPLVRMVQGGAGNALFLDNTQNGFGKALWARAVNFPIQATATSGSGIAIRADATSPNGQTNGVLGVAFSTGGFGVRGDAIASSGDTKGVLGQSSSTAGVGVEGVATASSGPTTGLRGVANSAAGAAGLFDNVAGGNVLVGQVSNVTKFRVDGSGAVCANSYRDLAGNPIPTGTGDITGVAAGTGLTGGGAAGDVSLALNTAYTDGLYAPLVHGHDVTQITNAARLGANTFTGTQTIDTGNLDLDSSTASVGNITKNGTRFLHNFGTANTFLGENAGNFTVSGIQNAAFGAEALLNNSSGDFNTAVGFGALRVNTSGSGNTATGRAALVLNNTGSNNTATGSLALQQNISGLNNTATGYNALNRNISGQSNTALGYQALFNNTAGSNNIAVGESAGVNATGSNNIYLGANVSGVADESNTIYVGNPDVQTKTVIAGIRGTTVTGGEMVVVDANGRLGSGPVALGANSVGSNEVVDDSLTALDLAPNSVGTSELAADSVTAAKVAFNYAASTTKGGPAVDLACVGCVAASEVSFSFASLGPNTFTGTQTITSGDLNLSSAGALNKGGQVFLHSAGTQNTFVGALAGSASTTGFGGNTAFGFQALTSLTSGDSNTAVGGSALAFNTDGSSNTAIGRNALGFNTNGGGNTVSGHFAMNRNTSGSSNTASGYFALNNNTTGSYNTVIGTDAMTVNSTGSDNTAIGIASLQNNNGGNNVAVGRAAGLNATTGSNNIYLGSSVLGAAGESNTMYLGNQGTQTKTFIAGIRGITTVNNDAIPVMIDSAGQVGTLSSSRRFKQDIHDMLDASRRLFQLRPVTFRYKQAFGDGSNPIQYGLIAEEVAEVFPELAVRSATGDIETVHYETLSVLLLNELQEQQKELHRQQGELRERRQELQTQGERIATLEQRLNELLGSAPANSVKQ
jgi:hypothetical protein